MEQSQLNWLAGFIWNIADDVLRDLYVRGKYRDVILPMTVLRRLDSVLEPTKQAVLDMKASLDKAGVVHQDAGLRQAAGQAFYNTSKFTLRDLRARANQQQLKSDFEAYLDGFSPNVQEILDNFEFRNQIPRLSKADALGTLIEKFLDPSINLSPNPIRNADGSVKHPGLDNHAMGTIFEELVRRFNEENNEEAGEHWTPRDAVKLMAKLIFLPIANQIESGTYLLYDGACGTGGMLTVAEETLQQLAQEHDKQVATHLYGQEINAETYAICKADLLLKGEGEAADNIVGGPEYSTLSNDAFPSREFDFMLSNPPYGKSWKSDLERMGGKDGIKDPRFINEHAGDPEYSLVTRSSDGQMLFLVNLLSKMKHGTKLGSRIAVSGTTYPNLRMGEYVSALLPIPPLSEQAAIVRFLGHADGRIRRYIRAKQKLVKLLEEQKQAIIHRAVTRGLDPNVRLKPSGAEWLGDVPEHWEVRPAKYFFREVDDRSETGSEELLSVSHITGVTPRSQKNITMCMASSYVSHKRCKPGDLVINTMWAWMAALGVARQTGIVSPSYAVYRPLRPTALLGEYADLLLRTRPYVTEYVCRSTGIRSSRLRLYPEQFLRVRIVCPPVNEQRVILAHLSAETREMGQAIAGAQRDIELLREYRTRLIADVVTGKLDVREAAARLPDEPEEQEPLDVSESEEILENEIGNEAEDAIPGDAGD